MCWKALFFFLNPYKKQEQEWINFGFRSGHQPPQRAELEGFERDVFNIVKSIKFRSISDNCQKKLRSGMLKIKKSLTCSFLWS